MCDTSSMRLFALACLACSLISQDVNARAMYPPSGQIHVHHIRKRSEVTDYTVLNRHVCPKSLCRSYDETNPDKGPARPRGTGGTIFFQGDIVLDDDMGRIFFPDEDDDREAEGGEAGKPAQKVLRRSKRATMKKKNRMWKNGVVPYRFHRDISEEAKNAFERGMKHIMKRTCIVFRPKKTSDKDFVRLISEPGCWSQVGRVGGVQLVSLGRGCENTGTAVHELVHALGTWHEQSRADRDKYIRVLDENISSRFKPDFETVSKEVSTSRGYPYDYNSLMHYSKYAFTKNAEPTIRVIGVGRELRLRIGQRRGLSTIDISQLRDMYKCNYKVDRNETVCPENFTMIGLNCYRFYAQPLSQFGPASRTCTDQKTHLLVLEDKGEERLITQYINEHYPKIDVWRMAGRRINNEYMAWYLGPASQKNITGYNNWAPGEPASFTSAVLKRIRRTKRFKWYGAWVGSATQKPAFEYSFICEGRRPARRKCVEGKFSNGQDYRGDLDHTREGRTCQKWTENYPVNHTLVKEARLGTKMPGGENEDGLGNHNHCRNPASLRRNRPWCYTTKSKYEWEYCDIGVCAKSISEYQKELVSGGDGGLRQEKENYEHEEAFAKRKVEPNIPKRTVRKGSNPKPSKKKDIKESTKSGKKDANKEKRRKNRRSNSESDKRRKQRREKRRLKRTRRNRRKRQNRKRSLSTRKSRS